MMLPSTIKKLAFLGALPLVACSTIHTKTPQGAAVDMNEAEFAAYLEHVFRHHNKVADDLMFVTGRSEGDDPKSHAYLLEMEAKMAHACLPLNELVSDVSAGSTPSFWNRMRLADAVPACERATRRVESLLVPDFGHTDEAGGD